MSSPRPSAVEELLARWLQRNPTSPVEAVVQRAVDLGFAVVLPDTKGAPTYLRLVLDPPAGKPVTLYVNALRLTAGGAAVRDVAAALPGAVAGSRDVQLPFDAVDPLAALDTVRRSVVGEPVTAPLPVQQHTAVIPVPSIARQSLLPLA